MKLQRPYHRLQSGFTLIELIIVIVIVGIMAAVAIPKYQDITNDARQGVLKAAAGAVASAAATNYALKSAGLTGGVAVTSCAAAMALATVPSQVTVADGATPPSAGVAGICVFTHSGGGSYNSGSTIIGA